MLQWFTDNFANIGSWSSIAGLVVTLWILHSIRKLKLHYTSKARIPQLIKQLEEYSSSFNSLLDDIDNNKTEIIITLKKLEFTLESLRGKTNENIKDSINLMCSRINKLKNGKDHIVNRLLRKEWGFSEESWDLYTDLQGILQGLKESKKDAEWDSP